MSESGNSQSAAVSRREVFRGGAGLLVGALAPSSLIQAGHAAETLRSEPIPKGRPVHQCSSAFPSRAPGPTLHPERT